MDIRTRLRTAGAVGIVVAAAACGGSGSEETAQATSPPMAERLQRALLTEDDVPGYEQRGVDSGTLEALGYQNVAGKLRDMEVDKRRCLTAYMGGLSGPAFQRLPEAPAAMAVFTGTGNSFGQIIVSVPAQRAIKAMRQPFPQHCSKIAGTTPGGRSLTMMIREIQMPRLGDHVRAFRGEVVVDGRSTVIWSETVRTGRVVHNIQLQGGDRMTLRHLAKQAHRKSQQTLA